MDVQRRAVEARFAEVWRAVATPLGHQPPLVTLRRTATGGGEATVWWADAEAVVAATLSHWSLPPLQGGPDAEAGLVLVAPTVTAAVSASWAAAAAAAGVEPPRVTLKGGQPAALTSVWASYDQMMAVMQSVVTAMTAGGGGAAAAEAGGAPGPAQLDRGHPERGGTPAEGGGWRARGALALARVADKGIRAMAQATLAAAASEAEPRAQRVPAAAEVPAAVGGAGANVDADARDAIVAMTRQSEMACAQLEIASIQAQSRATYEAAKKWTWYDSPDDRPNW